VSRPAQAKAELEARLRAFVGAEIGPPQLAEDAVNEAMIRHWCQALGDRNPVYTDAAAAERSAHGGIVAPPAMLQAWTMPGIVVAYDLASLHDRQRELHALLSEAGYASVVATDQEQVYHRYLRPGDRVSATTVIEAISEEKATALGTGYFIDTRTRFRDQAGEEVGWMSFRVLKFRPAAPAAALADAPAAAPPKPRRLRPPRAHDNGWWWEAIDEGRLLIQRCRDCGTLRHPPRPMCGACQSVAWDTLESNGRGSVHTYTVLHHPPIPGYPFPLPVALIDLEEGTRIVSNVVGCAPEDVHIGMRVECRIESVDEELKLPLFYPAGSKPGPAS
jgi:uncharacterized OB-fold protein/acyl dehydratase